jgi:acetolactate synthase I/III small subunit
MAELTRHTLSVLVENRPGVLARIAGLFSRRGFNIHSLAVGPTDDERVSRMTIVVAIEPDTLEQVTKQLNKLVHVLKIVELEPPTSVGRELQLVKVGVDAVSRGQVVQVVEVFRGTIVDVDHESVTVQGSGSPEKLNAMLEMLKPFGILEMVRTGQIALARGGKSITDGSKLRLRRVV